MVGGRKKKARGEEEPEAGRGGRKGVTTAALSITIFTTRRNLRDLNILCGGLAQALHNHSRASPGLYNYAQGWDSALSRARARAHICCMCTVYAESSNSSEKNGRARPGLKLIHARGQRDFHLRLCHNIAGEREREKREDALIRVAHQARARADLGNYTSTRHADFSTATQRRRRMREPLCEFLRTAFERRWSCTLVARTSLAGSSPIARIPTYTVCKRAGLGSSLDE